jgi:hypothetical protein
MTHPILEQHQINERIGEGLRVAARHRLINDTQRARQTEQTLTPPEVGLVGVARALVTGWIDRARRSRTTSA